MDPTLLLKGEWEKLATLCKPNSDKKFESIGDIAVDASGTVYFSDPNRHQIFKVNCKDGRVSVYAGSGTEGYDDKDVKCADAKFSRPMGLAVSSDGSVYVCDSGNTCIRKIDREGKKVVPFVGTKSAVGVSDGSGVEASFSGPRAITTDMKNNLFLLDGDYELKKISPAGAVASITLMDTENHIFHAKISHIAVHPDHSLYCTSQHSVLKITIEEDEKRKLLSGKVSVVAGGDDSGYKDECAATAARFRTITGITIGNDGRVYISDTMNNRVRQLEGKEKLKVSTIAGSGQEGSVDDSPLSGSLNRPGPLCTDAGHLFIVDNGQAVRMLVPIGGTMPGARGPCRMCEASTCVVL